MRRPHAPEFRQGAVELARPKDNPVAQIATDLGISDSCLHSGTTQADIDQCRRSDGLSTPERDELAKLCHELRVAKLEVKILKYAATYFAAERVLPNDDWLHRRALLGSGCLDMLSGDGGINIRLLKQQKPAVTIPECFNNALSHTSVWDNSARD